MECTMDVPIEMEEVFKAITNLLAWRKTNNTILQLVWMGLQEVKKCYTRDVRIMWIREPKNSPIIPYVITKRAIGEDQYKVVQAQIRTVQRTAGPSTGLYRGRSTETLERRQIPRSHAFLIQSHDGYKIIRGQIDISPSTTETDMDFKTAKEGLTHAILKLIQLSGQSNVTTEMEELIEVSSTVEQEEIQPSPDNITTIVTTEEEVEELGITNMENTSNNDTNNTVEDEDGSTNQASQRPTQSPQTELDPLNNRI